MTKISLLTFAIGMLVGVPLGTHLEKDYERCGVWASWDFSTVEQQASFELFDYPVSPCFGTGVALPLIDNGRELYVIDATGAHIILEQKLIPN